MLEWPPVKILPCPPPGGLADPRVERSCPAVQANSSASESAGKPAYSSAVLQGPPSASFGQKSSGIRGMLQRVLRPGQPAAAASLPHHPRGPLPASSLSCELSNQAGSLRRPGRKPGPCRIKLACSVKPRGDLGHGETLLQGVWASTRDVSVSRRSCPRPTGASWAQTTRPPARHRGSRDTTTGCGDGNTCHVLTPKTDLKQKPCHFLWLPEPVTASWGA